MDFVDASFGKVIAKLKSKKLLASSLIIVASKHGQAPIKRSKRSEVDPDKLTNATGVPTAWITTDDIALVFLNSSSDTATAVANLKGNASALHIQELIYGANLTAMGFGDPTKDPVIPNIIIRPNLGTCYTTSKSKIAEHGGMSDDDRHVACFISNPGLKKTKYTNKVNTTQVAPTIMNGLRLKASSLKGAVIEGTMALEGFTL